MAEEGGTEQASSTAVSGTASKGRRRQHGTTARAEEVAAAGAELPLSRSSISISIRV
jgi:hypothetical protein